MTLPEAHLRKGNQLVLDSTLISLDIFSLFSLPACKKKPHKLSSCLVWTSLVLIPQAKLQGCYSNDQNKCYVTAPQAVSSKNGRGHSVKNLMTKFRVKNVSNIDFRIVGGV